NWNVAQTVTVTGADDLVQDGDQSYTIVLGAASSTDPNFSAVDAADVAVTNTDDDAAGITVMPTAGLVTTEAGATASFDVVLTSEPTADVTVLVSNSDASEGQVSVSQLTFTPADWNVGQTVTVTGVDDAVMDGDQAYTIVLAPAISSDARYAGMDATDVAVSNTDDDAAGVTVTPVVGLMTDEYGTSASFSVVLTSQPTADVTIAIASSDATEGAVSLSSLVFTPANWATPQVVTVTGVDDAEVDGDQAYTILTGAVVSSDPTYAGMAVADVMVMNTDGAENNAVSLELVADRSRVSQGQPVGYRLSIRNRTQSAIPNVTISNELPARFTVLKGTLVMNATATDATTRAQAIASGLPTSLELPMLPAFVDRNGNGQADPGEDGYVEFRWQMTPGAGATVGRYTARVSAVGGCATCTIAPPTSATIMVEENEFFSRSTLLGRVFEDKDRDGLQSGDEPGLAGARVVMDDGTVVTTDAQGLFHVPDLEAGPRVIKMDLAAAGAGAVPTNGVSQVVDIAPGLLANVRFGVAFPRDTVTMGRRGVDGLAIQIGEPEYAPVRVSGAVSGSELSLNGVLVPLTSTTPVVAASSKPKAEVKKSSSNRRKAGKAVAAKTTRKKTTKPATAVVAKPATTVEPTVMVGDLRVGVGEDGRFEATVPPGSDEAFDVKVVDRKGRTAVGSVRLPRLQVTSPQGELRLPIGASTEEVRTNPTSAVVESAQPIAGEEGASVQPVAYTTVRGQTDAGASIQVNGVQATVAEDGSFAVDVPLHVGRNEVTMVATDANGIRNSAKMAVQVADRDAEGKSVVLAESTPELTVYLPPAGVPVQSPSLGLTGRTTPGNQVKVNGKPVDVNVDGTFSQRMTLAEGANPMVFEVTDAQGRTNTMTRELELRSPKMFLVALADGVVGQESGAAFLRKSESKTYTEGRVAWNLRGWIAGKYLLTSAFDSRRRDWGSLFKNLDDNGRDRLMTNLDPDRLYPVFGDSGSVTNSELQGGRLYVGLQGDAVKASLGNFPIALDQVELAGFRRTLYGAQVRVGKTAGNNAIPSGTSVAVFGAQASHVKVHDVLEATGGTLYYLSHHEVLQGSAQVSLVVRDRVTGMIIARMPQRYGVDVMVKEFEGRLQFTRPISTVWDDGGLVGNGRLAGHPVTIEVDYETRGTGSERTAVGGRVTQALGSQLQLGTTVVDDQSGGGSYQLRGTDFTAQIAKGTRITGELASSSGRTGRAYNSVDGGLGWEESDSTGAQAGMAWKTTADVDLGSLMGKPGKANVSAYVRRVESGFVSDGEREGVAVDRSGFRAQMDAGTWGRFSTRFDHESRPGQSRIAQARQVDVFGLQ
ncbi:MAG: hypothetical protein RL760_750, partial [Candidatus Eisenbacteria bacterium]